jgi:hypothetical protein
LSWLLNKKGTPSLPHQDVNIGLKIIHWDIIYFEISIACAKLKFLKASQVNNIEIQFSNLLL